MIEAKELRIGNWVNVHGIAYTVNGEFISQICFSTCTWKKDVSPIPLTPEILEKCGFKKWGRDDMPVTVTYELGILNIHSSEHYKNGKVYGWLWEKKEENNPFSWEPKVEFESLHQLQNLYYSLTGEEINYTI